MVSSRNFTKIFKKQGYKKLRKMNPDLFVICSPASTHFKFINLIESYFSKKKYINRETSFNKKEKKLTN